ncbi:urease accessory protein UreD [Sorangium atrum]|uniref:Urease accessory protein UreD n=1 Tax=Sorangium atrum TaxID=2995308 RepID=A0ABT5BX03_9BACT|nr:urease accessory protein UreD [Sorangium aterium]MDC0678656.1 urease accessory protein UreD [Sorangium aterium]
MDTPSDPPAAPRDPPPPARRAGKAGSGELVFTRVGARTVLEKAFARSPLRLLAPKNHGEAAWVFVASFGGGLVGGDELHLHARVGRGAAALLSTQASTKVYRSPLGSRQRLEAEVQGGGLLVAIPDPVVCFAGSRYEQDIDVALADDASLVLVDALSSGRSARGERWAFDRYASHIRVSRGGRAALLDATLLDPAHGALPERMGRFDALATLVALGPRAASAAEALLAPRPPPERRAELVASASPLRGGGAVVRVAGTSVERVAGFLRGALGFLAGELGDDPFARKW